VVEALVLVDVSGLVVVPSDVFAVLLDVSEVFDVSTVFEVSEEVLEVFDVSEVSELEEEVVVVMTEEDLEDGVGVGVGVAVWVRV